VQALFTILWRRQRAKDRLANLGQLFAEVVGVHRQPNPAAVLPCCRAAVLPCCRALPSRLLPAPQHLAQLIEAIKEQREDDASFNADDVVRHGDPLALLSRAVRVSPRVRLRPLAGGFWRDGRGGDGK
jgi:hypothetical protein